MEKAISVAKAIPMKLPEDKSVKIDFMSHEGDFKLSVKGGSMNECKTTFTEIFDEVSKRVKEKKRFSSRAYG